MLLCVSANSYPYMCVCVPLLRRLPEVQIPNNTECTYETLGSSGPVADVVLIALAYMDEL